VLYQQQDIRYMKVDMVTGNDESILHQAACCSLDDAINYLLENDADNINRLNLRCKTSPLLACRSGH